MAFPLPFPNRLQIASNKGTRVSTESDFRMSDLPSVLDFYLRVRAPGITTSEENMIYLGSHLQNYPPVILGSMESAPEGLNFGSM